jgi:hypothetical protein
MMTKVLLLSMFSSQVVELSLRLRRTPDVGREYAAISVFDPIDIVAQKIAFTTVSSPVLSSLWRILNTRLT